MYSQHHIEKVRDAADIITVIQRYTPLKQAGKNWKGLSPFSQEKTPSFNVSAEKQIFKCFSSGKGGDVFKFVMEKDGLSFPDAVDLVGGMFNIEPEIPSPEAKKKYEEQKSAREILSWAHGKYIEEFAKLPPDHWAKQDIINRGLDPSVAIDWQIGFAPHGRMICDHVVNQGMLTPAQKAGLVGTKNDRNYDCYFNRQMIPIYDSASRLVGFGGRAEPGAKDTGKYINPAEGELYSKSSILFGLNRAAKSIRDLGFAILVEGYWDVIAMHEVGITNVVAACGTGFSQAKVLKKYTNRVLILFDGDEPGIKAVNKAIESLLTNDIKPEVCFLPDSLDPCDFVAREKEIEPVQNFITANTKDAIVWKSEQLLAIAGDDPMRNGDAVIEIADMLYHFRNEVVRDNYLELLKKTFKIKPDAVKKHWKARQIEDTFELNNFSDEIIIPAHVDKEETMYFGFYEEVKGGKTGYWFLTGSKQFNQLTNFVIKPLLHVYSKEDSANKRVIEITSNYDQRVLELPSKSFISLDQFAAAMFDEGAFLTLAGFGKPHLQKILAKIARQFTICWELRTLGWQKEGFFAYSNSIVTDGNLSRFDEIGIAEHNGVKFFSPSASSIQALERKDKDQYKNDRYLTYKEPPITFEQWCTKVLEVYGDKGKLAIAYSIISLFRDLFFGLEGFCPHLYAYGQSQSGKTVYAASISNLFFQGLPPFNLNQGTEFAFWNRLERFRNCPVVFNEFDEEAIREEWFRAIKAIYDGEGRERGKNKNKSETQEVESTLILLGQYLSTKDDGAVLNRCVIVSFEQANERTQKMIENFAELKALEAKGMSGILVSLLKQRDALSKTMSETYAAAKKEMREAIKAEGKEYKDRIVNNYCYMITAVREMSSRFNLGFSPNDFFQFCKAEIIRLSVLLAESSALADFWKTLEFLLDSNQIIAGFDFKIETHTSLQIRGEGKDIQKTWAVPTKLFFLRLSGVHKRYLQVHRQQRGTQGVNEQTVQLYFKTEESFVGNNPSSRFMNAEGKSMTTSSYVFDYDQLAKMGVNFEREAEDTRKPVSCEGVINSTPELIDNLGDPLISFQLVKTDSYDAPGGLPVKRTTTTLIHDRDTSRFSEYTRNSFIQLTGMLYERVWTGKDGHSGVSRTLDVTGIVKPEVKEDPF